MTGAILGAQSPVVIGCHVFIGMNATVMRGVTIGDNVIIGASSMVLKNCKYGGVYAGNAAKKMMAIEDYYVNCCAKQFDEAKLLAKCHYEHNGKAPAQESLHEYFLFFVTETKPSRFPNFIQKMKLMGNYDDTVTYMENTTQMFSSYEEFLKEALFIGLSDLARKIAVDLEEKIDLTY